MATIKAIEGRSIHQIQSGQVIVDLCSVAKELVENSLDAGATSIEVRFKNHGLDSIEVQDNGGGIAPEDYETIALKHHTSKLSDYSDLSSLSTFGFRGEALSSLCAMSNFSIVTARQGEAPKGTKLEFETSGRLKGTQVVASQRGSTVVVENLFQNLPVRRRELEKNIKREYGKVLGLLYAYACISTGMKFVTSNQMAKGKKAVVFATKSNVSTKENIANVFGAKTLGALVPLDLRMELRSSSLPRQTWSNRAPGESKEVRVTGHISRPVFGEGRQTPDRQMFFVNGRPCGLPQVSKAFNEVYKAYNVAQSPFIFADLILDTNSYDVNVSPDKRTIMLHDQNALLENLKTSLAELFDSQDQTTPQSQLLPAKGPSWESVSKVTSLARRRPSAENEGESPRDDKNFADDRTRTRGRDDGVPRMAEHRSDSDASNRDREIDEEPNILVRNTVQEPKHGGLQLQETANTESPSTLSHDDRSEIEMPELPSRVRDFNQRLAEQEGQIKSPAKGRSVSESDGDICSIPSVAQSPFRTAPGIVQNAFDRMRPKRTPADTATITIGSKTTVSPIMTPSAKRQKLGGSSHQNPSPTKARASLKKTPSSHHFAHGLRAFAAPESVSKATHVNEPIDDEAEESPSSEAPTSSGRASLASQSGSEPPGGIERLVPQNDDFVPDVEEDFEKPSSAADDVDQADYEYIDEAARKAKDENQVEHLIEHAEMEAREPQTPNHAIINFLNGPHRDNFTCHLTQNIHISIPQIEGRLPSLFETSQNLLEKGEDDGVALDDQSASAEEKLSLKVAREDFAGMRVVGQFNLGFILTVRPMSLRDGVDSQNTVQRDELFIIDQHASDEKYNFERLQVQTVVQDQPLVKPLVLELTAVEEEIMMDHIDALVKNGFNIDIDMSGEEPVGQRCKLTSLPMSREVVFDLRDLEELISLLAEASSGSVVRPSKVRRMFAMRACRSSIMIGRTLTSKQMDKIVRHMGEIEKPWNCPHGRPTMRHLLALENWDSWKGDITSGFGPAAERRTNWSGYVS